MEAFVRRSAFGQRKAMRDMGYAMRDTEYATGTSSEGSIVSDIAYRASRITNPVSRIAHPLPERLTPNGHGGPLMVIRGLRNLEAAAEIRQTPWNREAWGPAFLAGLRPDGIGYSIVPGFLVVLDLNDPEHPRELARLPQPGLKPRAKH